MARSDAFVPRFVEEYLSTDPEKVKEPQEEIGPKDHFVGLMDDNLKRLYALRDVLKNAIEEFEEREKEHQDKHRAGLDVDREECYALTRKRRALDAEARKLNAMFWDDVRALFPEVDGKNAGVRAGFKVVWTEDVQEESPPIILKMMNAMGTFAQTDFFAARAGRFHHHNN